MSPRLMAAVFAAIACPAVSFAQVVTPRVPDESRAAGAASTAKQSTGGRWEIEGHGGLSRGTAPSSGDAALPPPGLPIPSLSPLFPSRSTASWFFGDGAAMLNSVNEEFGLQNRITPLDTALASLGLDYSSAAAFGVRLRRMLTDRVSAEASFDVLPGSGDVSEEFLDAVGATRASFEPAFAALFSTGPVDAVAITAASREASGSSREVALTGALNMHFGTGGGFVPYVTFGAGILSGMGDLPSVTLEGDYQFAIVPASGPSVPIHETDEVTLRFEHSTVFVGLAGGGLRKQMSDRWGFRIDGRVLIGPANSRLVIDATPAVTTGAPADFIETATNPNIQFSNSPATGRQSTLSGPPLDGFTAFKATGVQTRVLITVGIFVRF